MFHKASEECDGDGKCVGVWVCWYDGLDAWLCNATSKKILVHTYKYYNQSNKQK